jgi:hypothetical protein
MPSGDQRADQLDADWGEWMTKLRRWQDDAGMGDNGEKPTIELEFDGDWWSVSASSFYDGYADARAKRLEDAAHEVVERLTTHPERQLDSAIRSAALAFARVARCSLDEAEAIIREKRCG